MIQKYSLEKKHYRIIQFRKIQLGKIHFRKIQFRKIKFGKILLRIIKLRKYSLEKRNCLEKRAINIAFFYRALNLL